MACVVMCASMVVKRGQHTGAKNAVLNAFHMRCLHSILGLSWRDRVPNTSVLQTTCSYDLITIIRHRRLRWAGHVCRMEGNRLPKQVLYCKLPNAPRQIGRPQFRFREVLKRDLNAFNITSTSWEKLACNKRVEVSH